MIAAAHPPVVNRIAGYMAPAPQLVPDTPEGKQAAWGDALFAAAMFYQSRLAHHDPDVAERAARALFDLEKTRLRHGRELAGAPVENPKKAANHDVLGPLPDLEPLKPAWVKPEVAAAPEATHNRRKDAERVEAIAKTEKFAAIVATCRETLHGKGIVGDEAESLAVEFAKQMVLDAVRERREARAKRPPECLVDPAAGG